MSDAAPRFLGVRATGGPLLDTSVALSPGLTVLYGLNGAGKSRLLEAVHVGLTGQRLGLDRQLLLEPLDVVVYLKAPDEATKLKFEPAWDRLEDLILFPGVPYREDDLPLVREALFEVKASPFVALIPDDRPGQGWIMAKAVLPAPGSHVRALGDRDDAYRRWALMRVLGDDGADFLAEQWGFLDEEQGTPEYAVDGLSFLHTEPSRNADGDDPFLPLPQDGLPIMVLPPYDRTREATIDMPVRITVVANGGPDMVGVDTAGAVRAALSGQYVTAEDGWQWHQEHRDRSDAAKGREVAESLRQMGFDDVAEDVHVAASGLEVIRPWLEYAAGLADAILHTLLLDAPTIGVALSEHPLSLVSGRAVVWQTEDGHPLEALSNAERRWAAFAIRLALRATTASRTEVRSTSSRVDEPLPTADNLHLPGATFLLVDEPEAALHRTAEQHMAAGLAALARMPGMHVLAATHSPHLLDEPTAQVIRVHRQDRTLHVAVGEDTVETVTWSLTSATPLEAPTRRDLAALGLEPSDLLRRQRIVLLVEGLHDELIIEHLLGDNLARGRAHIIALRGGKDMHLALESRLLFDFTDAVVIPVLDNLSAAQVADTWDDAVSLAAVDGPVAAKTHILQELPKKRSAENKFMGEFLCAAIDHGVESRVRPFGLSRRDILTYLPVAAFTTKVASWDDILAQFEEARSAGATSMTDWKAWAAKVLDVKIDHETILDGLHRLDRLPEDFALLQTLCDAVVSRTAT